MTQDSLGREAFAQATGVSRETLALFDLYADMLSDWQARVNLVGPATLPDLWTRHFLDSAQLVRFVPETAKRILDIGSGAGFPGLVLAMLLRDRPGLRVDLVESTQKKSRFLEAVVAATGAPASVHAVRAEAMPVRPADVITARAVADLDSLLALAVRFQGRYTICVFPKGRTAQSELAAVARRWNLSYELVSSQTDPLAQILLIRSFARDSR